MTSEEFRAMVLADLRHHWEAVSTPDGDPHPRLYMWRPDKEHLHEAEIPLSWFVSPTKVGELWARLRMAALAGNVGRMAVTNVMIAVAHAPLETPEDRAHNRRSLIPPSLVPPGKSLKDHAESFEIAQATILEAGGCTGIHARIERHDDAPPTIGEWETVEDMSGRLADIAQSLVRC